MLISIVTVCLNDRPGLINTLSSIEQQDESLYESVVIDGGSKDGSVNVILESRVVDKFLSEKDSGIYEAMNKGVSLAQGEYIVFLNSGDVFFSANVIEDVVKQLSDSKIDFLYGQAFRKVGGNLIICSNRPLASIWKRMPFSHQALFTRSSLLKNLHFDESKKIAGDFKFIYTCYCAGCSFLQSDINVSILERGGVSDTYRLLSIVERFRSILEVNDRPGLAVHCFYRYHMARCFITQFIKKAISYFYKSIFK